DLAGEPFETWLLKNARKSARTRNAYRESLVSFSNWCVATNRLLANPFSKIAKANQRTDRRRQRRAMTEDELTRLLAVARERRLKDAMTVRQGKRKGELYANLRDETRDYLDRLGLERALIYKTMVLTGLRKGELASLTVGQLFLDSEIPYVQLDAADEKN